MKTIARSTPLAVENPDGGCVEKESAEFSGPLINRRRGL